MLVCSASQLGARCTSWSERRSTTRCPASQRRQKPQQRSGVAAGAANGSGPAAASSVSQPKQPQAAPQPQEQSQQDSYEFDIVSGSRVPQAQGPTCDWPRLEQRQRWKDVQDTALITTGFPVPAGYGSGFPATGSGMLWRLRNPEREGTTAASAAAAAAAPTAGRAARGRPWAAHGTAGEHRSGVASPYPPGASKTASPLVPVFRAAPYSAEAARQRRSSPTTRILFLDDGCSCRAVLAQAILQNMLSKLPRPLDVEVHAASIGPPAAGGHDERVVTVAKEMEITLAPRQAREFDEMRDTPAYDLILVMDKYDRQEVVREVSVLERLNPGGAYLTRVHRLSHFARAGQIVFKDRCLLVPEDVPDPFYGALSTAAELASLKRSVQAIGLCCRGLVTYMLKLRSRCGTGAATVPLRVALAQSLQCPLIDRTSHHALSALIHCQLAPAQLAVWEQQQQQQEGQAGAGGAAGARNPGGARAGAGAGAASPNGSVADWAAHIKSWPRPVWLGSLHGSDDEDEIEGEEGQRPLWTVREVAGQRVVVRRPRPNDRSSTPRGYWSSVENVQQELSKWMEHQGLQGRLPSQRELRRSGANTLSSRVDSHGGLAVFAERMGLPLASGRMPNGQWADFGTLAAELRRFVGQQAQQGEADAQAGEQPEAPRGQAEQQAEQAAPAIVGPEAQPARSASVGPHAAATIQQQQQQQLRPQPWLAAAPPPPPAVAVPNAPLTGPSSPVGTPGASTAPSRRGQQQRFASRSWSSIAGAAGELGLPGVTLLAEDSSPASSADLGTAGKSSAGSSSSSSTTVAGSSSSTGKSGSDASGSSATSSGGGGGKRSTSSTSNTTAGSTTTSSTSSTSGSAGSTSNGSSDSSLSSGELVFLPTQQELRTGGRADLIGAIRAHGGSLAVARQLGWVVHHGRLPSEVSVLQQLLDFAQQQAAERGKQHSKAGGSRKPALLLMPTLRQLEEGGRSDLAGAVQRLGGVQAFGHLLTAEQQRRRQRQQQPQRRVGGVAASGQPLPPLEAGGEEALPLLAGQQAQPQEQLSQILSYYPGSGAVRRTTASTPPQPAVVRVGQAVVQLIEARGWERRVPTKQELLAAGRRDLHAAITKCGGAQKLAEHLQLPYTETRGRRKQGQAGATAGPLTPVQRELQPAFLAARLRPPPGMAATAGAAASSRGRSSGGAAASAAGAAGRAPGGVLRVGLPQGPVSRLLEKELVLEAYADFTFV